METRRFEVGYRTVLNGVQVAPLLGLEELCADRYGRPVPPEPAEDVGTPRWLSGPATWCEIRPIPLKVKTIAALGNGAIALQ